MDKKHYFIIVGIILVLLVLCFTLRTETNKEQPADDLAETVSGSEVSLVRLQASLDWNPTIETEGIHRVEDNRSSLHHGALFKSTTTIWRDRFVFTTPDYFSLGPSCPIEAEICKGDFVINPKYLNEFIVTSDETGEVLHKYRLAEGYSFVHTKSFVLYGVGLNIHDNNELVPFIISKWNNFDKDEKSVESSQIQYYFNPYTGEITK